MTINEAIMQVDQLLANKTPRETKIRWLSDLDYGLFLDVILTHETPNEVEFVPYDENTDGDTKLVAEAPHDAMYIEYLKMKINSELYEYARYNSNMQAFNTMLDNFKAYYNRNYKPSKYFGMRYWG